MKYKLSHGVAIALMMPTVMEFKLISNMEKYAEVTRVMGKRVERLSTRDVALASVGAVKKLIGDVGIPTRLREVGAPKSDFPGFAKTVVEGYSHHLANNPMAINENDLISIYESAF